MNCYWKSFQDSKVEFNRASCCKAERNITSTFFVRSLGNFGLSRDQGKQKQILPLGSFLFFEVIDYMMSHSQTVTRQATCLADQQSLLNYAHPYLDIASVYLVP
jgi:hypothetical protein